MSISSLFVAVIVKKILFKRNIKLIFSNQFTYKKSGFWPADIMIRYLFRQTDKIVNVSNYSARQLAESFNLTQQDMSVCYSWQPLPKLTKRILRELGQRKNDKIKILYVGRIVPEKGIKNIIDLARYIDTLKNSKRYELTVAGDSNHAIKDELIDASNKYQSLTYVGRVDRENIWDYYASNDVFLFPAQSDGEGCNRIIIESYSLGMPVVSTNYGAIVEMLNLFPKSYVLNKKLTNKSVINAIDNMHRFTQKANGNKFMKDCRKIVLRNYSSKNFNTYHLVYNELLQ